MADEGILTMTMKERELLQVGQALIGRRLSQREAAEELGLTFGRSSGSWRGTASRGGAPAAGRTRQPGPVGVGVGLGAGACAPPLRRLRPDAVR